MTTSASAPVTAAHHAGHMLPLLSASLGFVGSTALLILGLLTLGQLAA